jgi:hypothetical protein
LAKHCSTVFADSMRVCTALLVVCIFHQCTPGATGQSAPLWPVCQAWQRQQSAELCHPCQLYSQRVGRHHVAFVSAALLLFQSETRFPLRQPVGDCQNRVEPARGHLFPPTVTHDKSKREAPNAHVTRLKYALIRRHVVRLFARPGSQKPRSPRPTAARSGCLSRYSAFSAQHSN